MSEIRDFKDLVVWQKSVSLAKLVYQLTQRFPREEQFGLTAQVRRAVISISSNIAEGHTRQGREFRHFLSIARGSLAEVESQLLVAVELGFTSRDALSPLLDLCAEVRRMAAALQRRLKPDP